MTVSTIWVSQENESHNEMPCLADQTKLQDLVNGHLEKMTKSGKLGNKENDQVREIRKRITEYQYVELDMITGDYQARIMDVTFMHMLYGGAYLNQALLH